MKASLLLSLLLSQLSGCFFIVVQGYYPEEIEASDAVDQTRAPLRVHLDDGRLAFFPEGAQFVEGHINGRGFVFRLNPYQDVHPLPVQQIDREDVLAIEQITIQKDGIYTEKRISALSVDDSIGTFTKPSQIESILRVHVDDGTSVIFLEGARISPENIKGMGMAYGLTGDDISTEPVQRIPYENVAAIEMLKTGIHKEKTTNLSLLSGPGLLALEALAITIAIFIAGPGA